MFEEYGFQYPQDLIMTFIGGSQLHGAKLDGTDDTDWYGVYIEPPSMKLGVDNHEHFVYTTGGLIGGNGPKDVDICLYSLGKWANLICKGNPSSLHFLFARPQMEALVWAKAVFKKDIFISKKHVKAFLGFANDQYKRLIGVKGQKNIHRTVLEELYGYDTKYAMHIARLYGEAIEFMETGRIILPRPNAEELIAIRTGKYKLNEFCELIKAMESDALKAAETSKLPEAVDRNEISNRVAKAYREWWEFRETGRVIL